VCDYNFGEREARVACREMGLQPVQYGPFYGFSQPMASLGQSGEYLMGCGEFSAKGIHCYGNESSLRDCNLLHQNCGHPHDIILLCLYNGENNDNSNIRITIPDMGYGRIAAGGKWDIGETCHGYCQMGGY